VTVLGNTMGAITARERARDVTAEQQQKNHTTKQTNFQIKPANPTPTHKTKKNTPNQTQKTPKKKKKQKKKKKKTPPKNNNTQAHNKKREDHPPHQHQKNKNKNNFQQLGN